MSKLIHFITICLITITILFILGCEDDAILKPQNESECTGSYCSLSLPISKNKNKNINPTIF